MSDFEGLQILDILVPAVQNLFILFIVTFSPSGNVNIPNWETSTLCCIEHFEGLIFNKSVNQVVLNLYVV
jgi:hypothetical protein